MACAPGVGSGKMRLVKDNQAQPDRSGRPAGGRPARGAGGRNPSSPRSRSQPGSRGGAASGRANPARGRDGGPAAGRGAGSATRGRRDPASRADSHDQRPGSGEHRPGSQRQRSGAGTGARMPATGARQVVTGALAPAPGTAPASGDRTHRGAGTADRRSGTTRPAGPGPATGDPHPATADGTSGRWRRRGWGSPRFCRGRRWTSCGRRRDPMRWLTLRGRLRMRWWRCRRMGTRRRRCGLPRWRSGRRRGRRVSGRRSGSRCTRWGTSGRLERSWPRRSGSRAGRTWPPCRPTSNGRLAGRSGRSRCSSRSIGPSWNRIRRPSCSWWPPRPTATSGQPASGVALIRRHARWPTELADHHLRLAYAEGRPGRAGRRPPARPGRLHPRAPGRPRLP